MANVVILPKANRDILRNVDGMIRHVSEHSANRWLASIQRAIKSLANNPEQHPEADEAAELGISLRFKMIGRRPHIFRILFCMMGPSSLFIVFFMPHKIALQKMISNHRRSDQSTRLRFH